jgi:hypothetical protein
MNAVARSDIERRWVTAFDRAAAMRKISCEYRTHEKIDGLNANHASLLAGQPS